MNKIIKINSILENLLAMFCSAQKRHYKISRTKNISTFEIEEKGYGCDDISLNLFIDELNRQFESKGV